MSSDQSVLHTIAQPQNKYKGVRRRRWGKWVSEIRVPGTKHRLWLGSYTTPEAAAVAHDVAFYSLHRPCSMDSINFPSLLVSSGAGSGCSSPRSVQKAASDVGMAVDARARMVSGQHEAVEKGMIKSEVSDENCFGSGMEDRFLGSWEEGRGVRVGEGLSISVEDYL